MAHPTFVSTASAAPVALPTTTAQDENAEARKFAQELSEVDLFQYEPQNSMPFRGPHFAYPPERPLVWIKFGHARLQPEADMQRLAWHWARSERQAGRCSPTIHIPEVFRVFTMSNLDARLHVANKPKPRREMEWTFIIMQLLDAKTLSEVQATTTDSSAHPMAHCYDLIAEGIQLLRRMPVPDDATPGPYTSDPRLRIISHPLFGEDRAAAVYQTVDELETHINRVLGFMSKKGYAVSPVKGQPLTVSLEKDLAFSFCDPNHGNFMFATDADGLLRLYILDFEHASFLPATFLSYAFLKHVEFWNIEFIAERIRNTLPETNLDALGKAYMLKGPLRTFGLKEVGDGEWVVPP